MFGLDDYPRKPLTAEQIRENKRHALKHNNAMAEYDKGKEQLRERLAKKYGVQWEPELEGDWETTERFYRPHVAEYDFDKFTPDQKVSYENDKRMAETLRDMYSKSIIPNLFTLRKGIPTEGSTIKFRRIEDKTEAV